jgi:hypothetical protein
LGKEVEPPCWWKAESSSQVCRALRLEKKRVKIAVCLADLIGKTGDGIYGKVRVKRQDA